MFSFSASLVSSVLAFILSFAVERIPGVKNWWAKFAAKPIVIAVAGLLITAGMVGIAYAGGPIEGIPKPFIWDGLVVAGTAYVSFLVASQAAYTFQASTLPRKQETP